MGIRISARRIVDNTRNSFATREELRNREQSEISVCVHNVRDTHESRRRRNTTVVRLPIANRYRHDHQITL